MVGEIEAEQLLFVAKPLFWGHRGGRRKTVVFRLLADPLDQPEEGDLAGLAVSPRLLGAQTGSVETDQELVALAEGIAGAAADEALESASVDVLDAGHPLAQVIQ